MMKKPDRYQLMGAMLLVVCLAVAVTLDLSRGVLFIFGMVCGGIGGILLGGRERVLVWKRRFGATFGIRRWARPGRT
jgi:hypothetical protein